MADGPVIQRASERALKQGTCIEDILQMVRRVRLEFATPIVLFSYYNPLLQYGLGRLAADAAEVGVDGVLVTDLTPEEAGEFAAVLKARDIDLIFLVAPTSSDDRIRLVSERASGFIYVVSRAGVTGQRETLNEAAERLVERVRRFSELPVAVGFGISSREQVAAVWRYADAAVVGSALVAECEGANANDLAARVGKLARLLAGTSA
jgi:tryptophan synthase alpha chain